MLISIDFGTCNTVISYYANNSIHNFYNPHNGDILIPSTITFLDILPENKNNLIPNEHYIIGEKDNYTFSKFKRSLGTNNILSYQNYNFSAQELVTLYFKGLQKIINVEQPEIIATIPAYFNDKQRNDLLNAIQNANFKVFKLFNEPTCAAVYYIQKFNSENNRFIILDIGGGTTDITVVEYNKEFNTCEIIDIFGNSNLGGIDIDNIVINDITNKYKIKKNINKIAEEIKITLSFSNKAIIYTEDESNTKIEYSRMQFERVINIILDDMLKDLFTLITKWEINTIDQIILVGGPTHIPLLQTKIKSFFKTDNNCNTFSNNLHKSIVANGGSLLYHIIKNKEDFTLLDILPMNIGIKNNHEIKTVIPKNTKIPCCIEYEFTTTRDGQNSIEIEIYEEDANIGSYTISNIPIVKRGEIVIKILFSLNNNGILELNIKNIVKNQDIVQNHQIKIISSTKKLDLLRKLLSLSK